MSDLEGTPRQWVNEPYVTGDEPGQWYAAPPPPPPPPAPAATKKRKRRVGDILLLLLALALLAGGAVAGFIALRDNGTIPGGTAQGIDTGLRDMHNNVVQPEDPEMLDPAYQSEAAATPEVDPTTGNSQGFRVPDLKMDVPLWSVNDVKGSLNPPGFTAAYLVRNRGVSLAKADAGTVYVVMHTVRSPGFGPGNYFIDIPSQTVTFRSDSLIYVGDRTYQFVSSELVLKTDIGQREDIWADTPGRLVIVTCWLNKQKTLDSHNLVIYAQLVS